MHYLRNFMIRVQIIESLQVIVVYDQRADIGVRGTSAELLEALAAQVESVAHQRLWKREKSRQYHAGMSATHVNRRCQANENCESKSRWRDERSRTREA